MSKKYCINCGALVPFKAKFCPSCGAPQQGSEAGQLLASAPVAPVSLGSMAVKEVAKSSEAKKYKDIPKSKLDKNAIWAFMFDYFVKTAILPGLMLFGLVVQPLVAIAALVVYFIVLYVSALIVYENFTYSTDDVGFRKSYGAIHKKNVTIPYQQVQNVNITRSFADRMFGLCHVSLETAGSTATESKTVAAASKTTAEGYLPGLGLEEAKYLHDLLLIRAQRHS